MAVFKFLKIEKLANQLAQEHCCPSHSMLLSLVATGVPSTGSCLPDRTWKR